MFYLFFLLTTNLPTSIFWNDFSTTQPTSTSTYNNEPTLEISSIVWIFHLLLSLSRNPLPDRVGGVGHGRPEPRGETRSDRMIRSWLSTRLQCHRFNKGDDAVAWVCCGSCFGKGVGNWNSQMEEKYIPKVGKCLFKYKICMLTLLNMILWIGWCM